MLEMYGNEIFLFNKNNKCYPIKNDIFGNIVGDLPSEIISFSILTDCNHISYKLPCEIHLNNTKSITTLNELYTRIFLGSIEYVFESDSERKEFALGIFNDHNTSKIEEYKNKYCSESEKFAHRIVDAKHIFDAYDIYIHWTRILYIPYDIVMKNDTFKLAFKQDFSLHKSDIKILIPNKPISFTKLYGSYDEPYKLPIKVNIERLEKNENIISAVDFIKQLVFQLEYNRNNKVDKESLDTILEAVLYNNLIYREDVYNTINSIFRKYDIYCIDEDGNNIDHDEDYDYDDIDDYEYDNER